MKKQQKAIAREQAKVDRFNEVYRPGETVRVKDDFGDEFTDVVKYPASIMGGHTAMAWLKGKGSYLIDRVIGKVEMSDLQKLMDWNFEFAKRVFPEHCTNPVPPLHHLKKEVGETIEELEKPQIDKEKLLFEYADCLILLAGSAKRAGITSDQLLSYSFKKMEINEKRDWGKPDENGVYLHKKGGENG